MLTVLLWLVSIGVPCALVLRLSGVQASPQRATDRRAPRRQRRPSPTTLAARRPAQQRRRAPQPSRPRPAAPAPSARTAPARLPQHTGTAGRSHRGRSTRDLLLLVALVSLVVAVSIGGVLAALALALRAAVE